MKTQDFEVTLSVKVVVSGDGQHRIIAYNFPNDKRIMEEYSKNDANSPEKFFLRTELFSQGTNDGSKFSFDCNVPEEFVKEKIKLLEALQEK